MTASSERKIKTTRMKESKDICFDSALSLALTALLVCELGDGSNYLVAN